MATWLNDPIELFLSGIVGTSLTITVSNPSVGVVVVYDPFLGGWQPGWNGGFTGLGDGDIAVSITTIPALASGAWTVIVSATAYGGALGGGSWSFALATFAIVTAYQTSLNTVDVTFDAEPKHLDPVDPTDGTNRTNFVIAGPVAPYPERLLQVVTYEGDNTLRLWFDGELVPGEIYIITLSGIESVGGTPLTGLGVFAFLAFGAADVPVPLELETLDAYDIRNPLADRDAPTGAALGQVVLDETGDIDVEARRRYLRKRIFRRLGTRKGAMLHLSDYGLEIDSKRLLKAAELRKLQADAETQIKKEPGVRAVRVSVRQIQPGLVYLKIKVRDKFGSLDIEGAFGGDE